ncbi:hypothetical protein FSARC_11858 [Fusarium sarcochroum]|uniref:Adenosine deaminase domain-containing protein n=1 Tax=Fusarium sarcochroum TaxID=1208366 RepID=A0A8H4WZH3_9HYPO|nr:hypothetical protein FSARC_11858 [Fusarium sarcochroum]
MTWSTAEWLRRLPKAELHLHLEGTVTPETLVTLSEKHDSTPITFEEAQAKYEYTDFIHFLKTFKFVTDRLQTPEDYALIVREMMHDLHQQGVAHAEVYVAWGGILYNKPHLSVEDVMVAIEDARVQVQQEIGGPSILWIADATRQRGVVETSQVFRLAAELKSRFPTIIGVGIGGDEVGGPIEWFHELYVEAKQAGLRLTAHAGEASGALKGPLQIRAALEMGVERIGHALDAQHDDRLMDFLREHQVPLEINVTSNIMTGCCPSFEAHPLPKYLDKGLLCTINSDDPAMFGSTCLEEYILLSERYSLKSDAMRQLARNSVTASFLPSEKKRELISRIDAT